MNENVTVLKGAFILTVNDYIYTEIKVKSKIKVLNFLVDIFATSLPNESGC